MRRTLAEQVEHARREHDELLVHEIERTAELLAEMALVEWAHEATEQRVWFDAMVQSYESERW